MDDSAYIDFLQWALPRLHMQWQGFRKVRRQVCRRITNRIAELGLNGLEAYRHCLDQNEAEWRVLDGLCSITISRFFRDRAVWHKLGQEVLPELALLVRKRNENVLRCWTAGCSSGEEPYSMVLAWHFLVAQRIQGVDLRVIGTDIDGNMIARGRRACYPDSSLREVPLSCREQAFVIENGEHRRERNALRQDYRDAVNWMCQDIRNETPEGSYDIILCRNLVFTYFDTAVQRSVLARLTEKLHDGGALVIGKHEVFPSIHDLVAWFPNDGIFRMTSNSATTLLSQ